MSSEQDNLKQLGNNLVQKQQYEQAVKLYDRALEIDSTSEAAAAIFSNRSLCYLNTKKYKDALQDAEKAISLRPTWHRGYQRAAAACEKLDKHEEGLKHLEQCFELDKASRDDVEMKRQMESFKILNSVKQKAPSMTQDELKQIGNDFVKTHQYEQAITIYTLAIEKDAVCDAAAPILSNRSLCYYSIGKYKEAYEDGGFCCGIKPDWAKGFMRRGVAAERLGEWQIALESYDEYLKLDPRDEAGIAQSRKALVAVLALKKREEEQEHLERQELKRELEGIKDPNRQLVACIYHLMKGNLAVKGATFDIERMKIAMSQSCKPRLDTPVLAKFVSYAEVDLEKALHPNNVKLAKQTLAASPKTDQVVLVAELALSRLRVARMHAEFPMMRQVQYLDFLLDLVEEQDFLLASEGMVGAINYICGFDSTSPDPRFSSIRKDLVITLFDRIETSRKLFLGKSATNKDFATAMLLSMCAGKDPRLQSLKREDYIQVAASHSKDICSQDLYECICTAMKNGADPNASSSALNNSLSSLCGAINNLRSVRVVELMLRYGANVNVQGAARATAIVGGISYGETTTPSHASTSRIIPTNPLTFALRTHRPDLVRALVSHGAKLPTENVPDTILKYFPPSQYPLVKPQYAKVLEGVLSSLPGPAFHSVLTHEYLQTLFEIISNQGLSFLMPSSSYITAGTPLTAAISLNMNLEILETMIKLKPDLLQQMIILEIEQNTLPLGITPLGIVIYGVENGGLNQVAYLVSVAKLLMKCGVDWRKDIVMSRLSGDHWSIETGETLLEKMIKGQSFQGIFEGARPGRNNRLNELKKLLI